MATGDQDYGSGMRMPTQCPKCSPDPKPVSAEELAEYLYNHADVPSMTMELLAIMTNAILEKYKVERR